MDTTEHKNAHKRPKTALKNLYFPQRAKILVRSHLEIGHVSGFSGEVLKQKKSLLGLLKKENPAYGRQRISRPMRIVAPPPSSF